MNYCGPKLIPISTATRWGMIHPHTFKGVKSRHIKVLSQAEVGCYIATKAKLANEPPREFDKTFYPTFEDFLNSCKNLAEEENKDLLKYIASTLYRIDYAEISNNKCYWALHLIKQFVPAWCINLELSRAKSEEVLKCLVKTL